MAGDLEKWQESVERNPALMDFTTDGFVEIWKVFPKHEKKLKEAFKAYTEAHALKETTKHTIEAKYIQAWKYSSARGRRLGCLRRH